jgi:hypothetical protein
VSKEAASDGSVMASGQVSGASLRAASCRWKGNELAPAAERLAQTLATWSVDIEHAVELGVRDGTRALGIAASGCTCA